MSEGKGLERDEDGDYDHLAGVEAGTGCTGIWEHLSEQHEQADEESAASD